MKTHPENTPSKAPIFLKAEWRKLALANYAVSPHVLIPYLPAGTELDLWNGTCYVSLVGFMFVNTRVLGIKVPYHVTFEEVNLRFYVRRKVDGEVRRGVVFIKEIVPRHALSWVANALFNEHYVTLPMQHQWSDAESLEVTYQWKMQEWFSMNVKAEKPARAFDPVDEASFITEHYWGYTRVNDNKTLEYAVEHPSWLIYPVKDYQIEVDFERLYGKDFESLTHAKPLSVFLAEGSDIIVRAARKIQ